MSALRGLLRVDCVVLIESLSILDIDSIEIPLRTEELQKETGRGEEWKGEERSGEERRGESGEGRRGVVRRREEKSDDIC